MYGVRFTPEARRDLGGIPDKVRPAIFEAIDGTIATNPQRAGKALRLQLEGLYAARRGEYRIVYAIDESEQMVTIHRVEHRRDAYR
ncbi:MAG: type II toxin-antitoxin system RelE family toxin [Actinomycetota bacterium]